MMIADSCVDGSVSGAEYITLLSNLPSGDLALTATYDGLSFQSNLLISVVH